MTGTQDTTRNLLRQGVAQARRGETDRARETIRRAAALEPHNQTAWLCLAGLAADPRAAAEALERVRALNPRNPYLSPARQWLRRSWPDYPPPPPPTVLAPAPPADAPPPPPPPDSRPSLRKILTPVALFLARRLVFGALVLVSIMYLSHLGLDMARGTPLGPALGIALTKSLAYVGRLLRGDLGLTAAGIITGLPAPVAEVVPDLLLKSLGLLGVSLALATVIGFLLGLLAAGRRRSGWSLAMIVASIAGVSLPSFFAALLLQIVIIQWTR